MTRTILFDDGFDSSTEPDASASNIAAWVTATEYVVDDVVRYVSSLYYCTAPHTSDVWATDSANWALYVDAEKQIDVITTRGDAIRGDSSGDAERLGLGSSNTFLGSDGSDLVYATPDHANISNNGSTSHADLDTHYGSSANPHTVTQTQVGLGNCDNTSDTNKPVSTAQQTALDLKAPLTLTTNGDILYYGSGSYQRLGKGSDGEVLTLASGIPAWVASGSGDVFGPGSSTDNALCRFNLATGKLIQNSVVIVDDSGNMGAVGTLGCGAITSSGTMTVSAGGLIVSTAGQGITFTGGGNTALNHYEEDSATQVADGESAGEDAIFNFTRIGRTVELTMRTDSTITIAGTTLVWSAVVPANFRPTASIYTTISCVANAAIANVTAIITSAGNIQIHRTTAADAWSPGDTFHMTGVEGVMNWTIR